MLLTKCFRTQSPGFVYKIILYVVFFLCEATVKVGLYPSFQVAQLKQCMWAIKGQLDATILFVYKRNIASGRFSPFKALFWIIDVSGFRSYSEKSNFDHSRTESFSNLNISCRAFCFQFAFFFFKQTHIWFFSSEKKRCYSFPSFFFFQNIVLKDLFSFLNNPLFGFQFGSQFGEK